MECYQGLTALKTQHVIMCAAGILIISSVITAGGMFKRIPKSNIKCLCCDVLKSDRFRSQSYLTYCCHNTKIKTLIQYPPKYISTTTLVG